MRRALAFAGIVLAVVLSGCAGASSGGTDTRFVRTGDGRLVECITWKTDQAGGLSCDWDRPR